MTKAKDRLPTRTASRFARMAARATFPPQTCVAALGHFQELLRQIPTSTWAAVTKASGAREHISHFADNVVA